MLLTIPPEEPEAAHGVSTDARWVNFAMAGQPVNELSVGGQENVVGSAVLDLLGQRSGSPRYETKPNWVRFFKLLLQQGFHGGEVGRSSYG